MLKPIIIIGSVIGLGLFVNKFVKFEVEAGKLADSISDTKDTVVDAVKEGLDKAKNTLKDNDDNTTVLKHHCDKCGYIIENLTPMVHANKTVAPLKHKCTVCEGTHFTTAEYTPIEMLTINKEILEVKMLSNRIELLETEQGKKFDLKTTKLTDQGKVFKHYYTVRPISIKDEDAIERESEMFSSRIEVLRDIIDFYEQ